MMWGNIATERRMVGQIFSLRPNGRGSEEQRGYEDEAI